MRKEYWSATWVKINFSLIALMFHSVSILGVITGKILQGMDLIVMDVLIFLFGIFFLAAAFVAYKWPLIIIDDNVLIYQRFFKTNRIDCLSDYWVDRTDQQITLVSKAGKKIGLGSTVIGKKNVDELHGYILDYCEALPKIKN